MIVVVDTNVFVAATLSSGGPGRAVLRACLEGRLEPLMGAALFTEHEALLSRREPFARSPLSAPEREALFDAYLAVCRWTVVYYLWRPNLPDEADNHVVELAVAGGAEAIVTENTRDFRRTELLFPRLQVLRPAQLMEAIGWAR